MSDFNSEYAKLRKKRLKESGEDKAFKFVSGPFQSATLTENDIAPVYTDNNTKTVKTDNNDKKETGLFQASGLWDDGFDVLDIPGAILGTAGDVATGIVQGIAGIGEGLGDLVSYGIAGVADLFGNDSFADDYRREASKNYVGAAADWVRDKTGIEKSSVLGDFGDSVASGVGYALGMYATGGLGKAAPTILSGTSAMGSGMSEAYQGGATDEEALKHGLNSGVITAGANAIFGGLGKGSNAIGVGKGLSSFDDILAKKLSSKISNHVAKNAVQYGVKATGEGFEEVVEGFLDAVSKKSTYMSEEEFNQILEDEKLFEQFMSGVAVSGIMQAGGEKGVYKTTKNGRDFVTGFSANEQTVIDKEFENRVAEREQNGTNLTNKEKNKIYEQVQNDMKKGYISTDTIESVLGGETYKAYKDTVDSEDAIFKEFDELGKKQNATLADQSRYAELQEKVKEIKSNSNRNNLKSQLSKEVYDSLTRQVGKKTLTDDFLIESYNERARRGKAFEADLSEYDDKTAETVKKAIDSGILNNTRRTHEFVDMLAKISADKGVLFDFTNNAKLKESGFAIDGKVVNGYVDTANNTIGVNIDSSKAYNSVVGHEITHVLEGTELYGELQTAIFEYAKSKKDYDGRRKSLEELYKNVDGAEIDAELTADLVGDYLFTDADFINNLSTKHRNVFKKIYDEIKYLLKIATTGSKEARELEKAKKAFDEAYRANVKASGDVKYSLTGKTADGIEVYETSQETMALTWDERKAKYLDVMKNEYRGRTAKFVRNGHTYYAKFDQNSIRKPVYGDNRSSEGGKKALIKAGADGDIFELVENSQYNGSSPNRKNHTDADYFDYFVKTVQIDGKLFDLVADVEKKVGADGGFVYTLALRENKNKASTTHGTKPVKGVVNASNGIIPQNSKKSSGNTKFSLSADSEGRELSTEQREYFKDSKVRDENGNLLEVYHGTKTEGINIFEYSKDRQTGTDYGKAYYFTSDFEKASGYSYDAKKDPRIKEYEAERKKLLDKFLETKDEADKQAFLNVKVDGKTLDELLNDKTYSTGGEVKKVYLNLTNPLTVDAKGEYYFKVYDKYFEEAKANGNDGIIVKNVIDVARGEHRPIDVYVAFENNQIKSVNNKAPTSNPDIRYSLSPQTDKDYLDAVERGDTETAQRMVYEAAKQAGYNDDTSYKMQHSAPNSKYDVSLYNLKESGLVPDDYWTHPHWYQTTPEENESFRKVKSAIETQEMREAKGIQSDATMWVYRAVDKTVNSKEDYFRNGDWVTPSYDYAVNEGKMNPNGYRIIKQRVSIKDLYWDGNSIAELGYDDGNTYAYKDTTNNRKLLDPVTYDDFGKVIPLSKRFKYRNSDVRYSLSAEGETPKHYGTYNIFGDDIRLEAPTQEEIAPIQEDIAKNATTTDKGLSELELEHKIIKQKFMDANRANDAEAVRQYSEKLVDLEGKIAQAEATTTEKAVAPKERTPSKAALANFTKKSKYSGGFNFQGGYSADGKQYLSDGKFAVEFNEVDESIPHNKDFPIKKLQNSLSEAVSGQSSEKYAIDFDKIVEINKANKNNAIVSVGGTLFDGEYIEAVMKAIPDSTFALSNYRGGLKPLVAVGKNGTAMIMPLEAGDNVTVAYEAQEAKSTPDFAPMPSEPTIYDLEQEQAELEKVIPQAMESNDPNAPQLISQYTELLDRIEKLKAEESVMDRERLASLDDVDVPPETENGYIEAPYETDNVMSVDDTAIQEIAQKVQSILYIEDKNMGRLKDLIRKYGESTREELYNAIEEEFGTIYEAGEVDPELLEIKKYLRNTPIKLNDYNKAELRYLNDGKLGNTLKANFGKLRISNKGSGVDSVYQELNELYPDYFPSDIEQEHDQLHHIFSIANMDSKPADVPVARIELEILEEATDLIINGINEYRLKSNAELADTIRKEQFDSLMQNADDIAPVALVAENKTVQNPRIDTAVEDIGPIAESAPKAEAYEAIKPKKASSEPRLKRVKEGDSRPGEKERKWIGTSTESEAVDGKILPEDLDQEAIHYQPISNKQTLNTANAKLNGMGYEASVAYFNSQFANKKTTLEDVVLGERLIQEAIKRGDTKTAGELIEDVAILGTELGQKVQALSIIKRLTPEGQLRMLQRTVERGKTRGDKAFEGVEITQEMIDKILKTYGKDGTFDKAKLNEAVEDVKQKIADQMKVTKMDKINAWRYLSMLGNPKTHIRNLVSNVAMRGTTAVKNVVARSIETFAPIENRTKTWKRASDEVKAFSQKTATEMQDILLDGGKYNEDASIKQKRAVFKNKILNGVYEFNSDMLSKEDWWFSRPAFTNALSEYLTANGIRTEQDIQKNPEIVAKAKQYATEQSQIATFRQYSWLANKINEIEHKNVATQIGVGAILPFKKTPINIAKTALNYSPLGFAKSLSYDAVQVKNGKMEASTLIDHLAQGLTGSAIVLAGYMLAKSGFINGAGDDDKEGDYDYQLGEQAYSINIGDSTYSLSWLSPIAMPLFVGANAYEQLEEGKEWNGDVVVETLAQTLDPLSEMSFLSSLDAVLSSYDSGIEKFAGMAQSAAQSYATQFVPTFSSQIATVMDDTKRSTKVAADSDFKFVDETVNKLKYKIPFLRETLEPSTDIWGNDIKQSENLIERAFETFIVPYAKKTDISSGVDEELKTLFRETGDAGLIPSIPYNYINYNGEKYEMSASEFTEYKKLYGQNAYELMSALFDTNTYKNASSEERADMVNKVYDYARDEAKREYFAKYGVDFTNATKEGEEYYKENSIKGAIEHDLTPDEYEFSIENPEKYKFLHDVGVSYEEFDNGSEEFKEAYSWAFKNPEKYTVSKAVASDVVTYRKYASDLYDIKADKDENGKSISGSRKEKVAEYINNLDAEYGEKIILFKSEYNADDTYNYDIIEYLNGREDISYKEMETILKELGFTVKSDGTIYWD